ncbi:MULTISPECIES: TraX family protein [Eubacteriales]|uniref:Fimbrial assembly protein n=1 Tax=Flintibacter hominis TaxID=2763048 RepID=A0A8J6J0E2_9FIRM|nr:MULTISPECIES: TraX family protein [Eubacteriales]MBC5721309.1 fimbrial assembly protein [Flintibacter hominis]MCU6703563.1 conjugal transfer protein TraX [Muriventricola aceti]SCJ52563.1 conjugal transfer protein TrbP [uncultured Flavonifractor sp.]
METKPLSAMPKLKTNLDTDFLKLIAILSMVIDHVGTAFFPEYPAFRWAGRLAFPIFAYCLTVGLLYTRDIRKYLLRLGAFALISQPFYIFAFHPWDWQAEWMNMNIFFTLLVSLLALWGVHTRRWWLFLALFLLASFVNFDYSANGIVLMLIFYLCRNRPVLGAAVYVLFWLPALWGGQMEDPLSVKIAGHAINWTIFAVLSAFPIFLPTHTGIKVPKWFFYAFYPAHLAAIGLARVILNV